MTFQRTWILFLTSFDKHFGWTYYKDLYKNADITYIVLTPHATLDSKMKSSGWVSRGDWSHPSRHTLWDVKEPQQKQQLWLQGKTVLPPINLLETKLGGNEFRLRTKSETLLCWSWRICRLRYSTTHATNVDISSKFGPPATSSTLPWAFLITFHLFLATFNGFPGPNIFETSLHG